MGKRRTFAEAGRELAVAERELGAALLASRPGRWLVAFTAWLARRLERDG